MSNSKVKTAASADFNWPFPTKGYTDCWCYKMMANYGWTSSQAQLPKCKPRTMINQLHIYIYIHIYACICINQDESYINPMQIYTVLQNDEHPWEPLNTKAQSFSRPCLIAGLCNSAHYLPVAAASYGGRCCTLERINCTEARSTPWLRLEAWDHRRQSPKRYKWTNIVHTPQISMMCCDFVSFIFYMDLYGFIW